jgi:hypothetical protein
MYATLFNDPDLINRMLSRYLSVTGEQIRDVAAAVFREDNRVVLTYLPMEPPADSASAVEVAGEAADEEVAA